MNKVWMFSQFYRDTASGQLLPVAAAYGTLWICPRHPETDTGWALICILAAPQQVAAAAADPRVVVCPKFAPLPPQVTEAYAAQGATAGMTMSQLLGALSSWEPIFGQDWNG